MLNSNGSSRHVTLSCCPDAESSLLPLAVFPVQTLKFKRDELFRNFEVHPGKLGLAREIKDIDDQIAELNAGKKKARADSPK
jgi:hypothetical protein